MQITLVGKKALFGLVWCKVSVAYARTFLPQARAPLERAQNRHNPQEFTTTKIDAVQTWLDITGHHAGNKKKNMPHYHFRGPDQSHKPSKKTAQKHIFNLVRATLAGNQFPFALSCHIDVKRSLCPAREVQSKPTPLVKVFVMTWLAVWCCSLFISRPPASWRHGVMAWILNLSLIHI